jgi:hypothetical protein
MATTTNYGWTVPTSADLVKNGATAISTLGQNIDTSMVDLRGGTVGQSLIKATSTEMDFAWSSTPSASNPVLNSAFQVWQRNTSISLAASTAYTSGFTADRWQTATGANQACTISRQATGDTTNLPSIQYALRYQRNSGQTGTAALALLQNFESINAIPFAGKTITFSFYARAGANYSAASSILQAQLTSGTGTDQNAFSSYTGGVTVISQSATLTTTWQRFTYTGSIGATATEFVPQFNFTPVGTAGTNDYYEITGVQIDIGSVALPFRTAGVSYQQELALCQRYYYRNTSGSAFKTLAPVCGIASTTTAGQLYIMPPVPMRVAPTVVDFSTIATYQSLTTQPITALTFSAYNTANTIGCDFSVAAGLVIGQSYSILSNNSATAYIGFGAEL